MADFDMLDAQPPARMVAGALAHLAQHMETGCPRATYLAAMLLEQVADDPEADAHLRTHARELVDILGGDAGPERPRMPATRAAMTTPHAPFVVAPGAKLGP